VTGVSVPAILELETPHGLARAHVHRPAEPRGAIVLGHGAGGGVTAPDLVLICKTALAEHLTVVLTEQPYRVAGRRSPAPAPKLDTAFISVVSQLWESELGSLPVVTGGRSSGARVACRTAAEVGAVGVLCLAFPLLAPRRRDGTRPSRLDELEAVTVPVLVIQGATDPFGMPPTAPNRTVIEVVGDHSLRKDHAAIAAAARAWLTERFG
jgi:predicted alpha/beta-hydrolase family hydrolase